MVKMSLILTLICQIPDLCMKMNPVSCLMYILFKEVTILKKTNSNNIMTTIPLIM